MIAFGFATAAAGFAAAAAVPAPPVLLLVAATTVVALGIAPVGTLATDLVVSGTPERRAGQASGLSETGLELGGALGIAVLGSLGLAVFRARGGGDGTFGAAVEGSAPAVVAARSAFASGMQITAVVAALVCAVVAAAAPALLAPTAAGRR